MVGNRRTGAHGMAGIGWNTWHDWIKGKKKKGKHGASADFNQSIFFAKANLTVQSPRETGHPSDFQRRGQRQNCAPEKRFVAFQVIPLKST